MHGQLAPHLGDTTPNSGVATPALDRVYTSTDASTPGPERLLRMNDSSPGLSDSDAAGSTVKVDFSEPACAPPAEQPSVRPVVEETAASFGDGCASFVIHELLGQGGYGSVYRCSLARSDGLLKLGAEFAVKVIDAQRISMLVGAGVEHVVPRLLREAEVIRMLGRHPHIVGMHAAFYSRTSHKIYLVYEYVRGGDLFGQMVRRRKALSERDAQIVTRQLAQAVRFGHSKGVAHRDLKMDNCLVDDAAGLDVKLCDYGQAAILGIGRTSKTLTTTTLYTAPDVHAAVRSGGAYDAFKADAFAMGVLLYALLCNAMPKTTGGAYKQHRNWGSLSESARNLIQQLLSPSPDERLSVGETLQHPWLTDSPVHSPVASLGMHKAPGNDIAEAPQGHPEQELLFAAHQLVVALQRERANFLWDKGSDRFHWHLKYTDKLHADALRLLEGGQSEGSEQLAQVLAWARTRTDAVRELAAEERLDLEPSIEGGTTLAESVMAEYSRVISAILRAIATRLYDARSAFQQLDCLRRLLMLAAEQLGVERALLCWHLKDPRGLRDPRVACRISQVIGARKLLLGSRSSASGSEDHECGGPLRDPFAWAAANGGIVADQGLFPALGLTEEPLLDADQLRCLEAAEDQALGLTSRAAPELSDWYWLLTKLIDRIHERIAINILEHFQA